MAICSMETPNRYQCEQTKALAIGVIRLQRPVIWRSSGMAPVDPAPDNGNL